MSYKSVSQKLQQLAKKANCSVDEMGYGEGNIEELAKLVIDECRYVVAENFSDCVYTKSNTTFHERWKKLDKLLKEALS